MAKPPIVIIPARGGSKGIPGKNIKLLGGRPLIAWTVDVARAIAPDSHIVLSTDSETIANAVQRMGLAVDYLRPAHLATDGAAMHPVILHALQWAVEGRGLADVSEVVLLQPTSPLRTAADVEGALQLLRQRPEADMVVGVCESQANPYYNLFEPTGPAGALAVSKGDGRLARRQDAPVVYEYNGAVYAMRAESVRRHSLAEMPVKLPWPMPRERSLDLDTPFDWTVAEALFANGHPTLSTPPTP